MHHQPDLHLVDHRECLKGSAFPCDRDCGQYKFRLALIHPHHLFLHRSNHLAPCLHLHHLPRHHSPPQTHHHSQTLHSLPLRYWLHHQLLLRGRCCAPVRISALQSLPINLRNQMNQSIPLQYLHHPSFPALF